MFCVRRSWITLVAAGLALACAGCPSRPSQKPAKAIVNARVDEDSDEPAALESKPAEPSPPPTIPKVNLSDELRAGCLVNVGDVLPKAELPDLAGKSQSLNSLYGKKLTVVFVWKGATRRALLEAADMVRSLTNDVAKPFQDKGVQVIGIEVGESNVDLHEEPGSYVADAKFPHLLDSTGQFLAGLAKDGKLPRVYLLDAQGKILWFDVEYSRSTREDLLQGIRVALGELK
jgi:hypothetical protein